MLSYTDQVYTICDPNKADYILPEVQIEPSFCEIDFDVKVTNLNNGQSALDPQIPFNNPKGTGIFSFNYCQDLSPLGQKQTVTLTATSKS